MERYKIIYIWKTMNDLVPNCGIVWSEAGERRGRMCQVPKLMGSSKVQKLRLQSFQMSGPKLWNALPRSVRNLKTNDLEEFKQILDQFLCKVPDEPKCDGLNPGATNALNGRPSNSILYQVARRTVLRTGSMGHLSKSPTTISKISSNLGKIGLKKML